MCSYHEIGERPTSSRWQLTRRDMLKLAVAAGVVAVPVAAGGRVMLDSRGQPFPNAPVFAEESESSADSPLALLVPEGAAVAAWQEMFRVEGFPYVRSAELTSLGQLDSAAPTALVVLPGMVSSAQVEWLRAYVEAGGGLIAIRPDALLASLCGLARRDGETDGGYLCVRPNAPGADGIANGALQFHAPLRHYDVREAEAVALLCGRDGVPTQTPAATFRRLGRGAIAVWCYDLAASVVLSRQGPPSRADVEGDGVDGIRAADMFVGFVDLDRIATPQADEQQRLLANMVNRVSAAPLPRLWYFPANAESLMVCTGDSHNNPAQAVDEVLRRVEQAGGTMSIYYTPPPTNIVRRAIRRTRTWLDAQPVVGDLVPPSDVVTPYHANVWRARGHEFALHPYVEEGLEIGWARYWEQFTGLGYGEFQTVRTHRVLWNGWTETPRVQAGYAVEMNLDYYHVGPTFQRADGTWAFGHFTGSGLPMRFIDLDGRLLNIWQQNTPLVDEQVIEMPWGANFVGSSPEEAIEIVDEQLRRTASGAYAALGAQFHFDPFAVPGPWTEGAGRYLDGVLEKCQDYGLPIMAASHWAAFAGMRSAAEFSAFQHDPDAGRSSFTVTVAQPDTGITLLLPIQYNSLYLSLLQANGKQFPHKTRNVGDTLYAVVVIDAAETTIDAVYSS